MVQNYHDALTSRVEAPETKPSSSITALEDEKKHDFDTSSSEEKETKNEEILQIEDLKQRIEKRKCEIEYDEVQKRVKHMVQTLEG